jgi:CRISPR/Cas system CSM-associated protein Csm3 (group 7 of RAMP superfamily)
MLDRAHNRLVIRLSMTTLAPLHVGAGDGGLDAAGADRRCAQTSVAGAMTPFVPGSTLRGLLRTDAQRRMRALGRLDGRASVCSAQRPCGEGLGARPAADRFRAHCPACRVFGSRALRGRLVVRDLMPALLSMPCDELEPAPVVRRRLPDGPGGWRELEVIPAGVRLHGELVLRDFQTWQLGVLAAGLRGLEQGISRLGGRQSLGFGAVAVSWPEALFEQPLGAGEAPLALGDLVEVRRARAHGLLPEAPLPAATGLAYGLSRRFTLDARALSAWFAAGTAALEGLA